LAIKRGCFALATLAGGRLLAKTGLAAGDHGLFSKRPRPTKASSSCHQVAVAEPKAAPLFLAVGREDALHIALLAVHLGLLLVVGGPLLDLRKVDEPLERLLRELDDELLLLLELLVLGGDLLARLAVGEDAVDLRSFA